MMNTSPSVIPELLSLLEIRKLLSCSQQELAAILGISKSQLHMAETGRRNLNAESIEYIQKISTRFFTGRQENSTQRKNDSSPYPDETARLSESCRIDLSEMDYELLIEKKSLKQMAITYDLLAVAAVQVSELLLTVASEDIDDNHMSRITKAHLRKFEKSGRVQQYKASLKIAMLTAGAAFTNRFILENNL